jgi:large subunit ribosomal protein L15
VPWENHKPPYERDGDDRCAQKTEVRTMNLHTFSHKTNIKRKKRIARGGKRGTTAGRGQKGQKSRAGHRIRPAERDIILRIPKRRGFRNRPYKPKAFPVNLKTLLRFEGVIDKAALERAGIWNPRSGMAPKILGSGKITKAVVVKGIKVSKNAKMEIEKAGGKIEP